MGNDRIIGNDPLSATLREAAKAKLAVPPDIGPAVIGAITHADVVRARIRGASAFALALSVVLAARRCPRRGTTFRGQK